MKYKTCDLTGSLLDQAVAVAYGYNGDRPATDYEMQLLLGEDVVELTDYGPRCWAPSMDWADGGPIIERERISVMRERGADFWSATTAFLFEGGIDGPDGYGPTPLIAAMRAFVASKLGCGESEP